MTDCAMYNITSGEYHPSTICVEMRKLIDSLRDLREVLESEYPRDSLAEFIEMYARTDQILPTDRTLGFVVVNSGRKIISLSFTHLESTAKDDVQKIVQLYREGGYEVDLDIS